MKKLVFILGFVYITFTLFAHYVENMPYTITQPDGSTYEAFLTGDEYYHHVYDENGYTMLVHPRTGYIVYAIPDGNSLKASDYIVGIHNPAEFGITPGLFRRDPAIDELRREQQAYLDAGLRAPPTGSFNNIVVFARFSDQTEFSDSNTYSHYTERFNSSSQQSLSDYYLEVSSGQLNINSYLYPPADASGYVVSIEVANPRAYYSPYNEETNPIGYLPEDKSVRRRNLIAELVGQVVDYIPSYLDFDTNGDGNLDAIVFIIRGDSDTWNTLLWPTSFGLSPPAGSINGASVNRAIIVLETRSSVSIVSHEMGHNIGFPDFYHYDRDEPWTSIKPVGAWCLMASDNAQHSLVYNKWKYGTWFESIPEITPTNTPTTYTLEAIDQSPYSAYKILSSDPDQYYIVEYRRQNGRYETGVPATGLIVYRIITSYDGNTLNGNANGPPDEVYIYRPGGIVDTPGIINNANYSSTVGRTEIHNYTDPKPWLYEDNFTTPDGDLVITDIGPAGDPTITFVLSEDIPYHRWTGSVSVNWHNPANWLLETVPTSTDDVIIPGGLSYYPSIFDNPAYCKNMTINDGATLRVDSANLNVAGHMNISGELVIYSTIGVLSVYGHVYWNAGSSISISSNDTVIYCSGNMYFSEDSDVQFNRGSVQFGGSNNSNIVNYSSTTEFNHLIANKTAPGFLNYSSMSTESISVNGNLSNTAGSTFLFYSSFSNMTLSGNLTNNGSMMWHIATLTMNGDSQTIFMANASDFLHHLVLEPLTLISLESNIEIKGNLSLQSGSFAANNHTIKVGGNWNNSVGPDFFIEDASRVIFNGSTDQYCSTNESFNILELYKTSGEFIINHPSRVVTCNSYDWTSGSIHVQTGTFTANSLADNGIKGTWFLNSGGTINLTNTDGWVDLCGNLNMDGGFFNVFGGTDLSYWPYNANASINMSGGVLDFKDQGVLINPNTTYTFSENITAGTIRAVGNFNIGREDFTPIGGTIELYGSNDVNLNMVANANINHLHINKIATGREEPGRFVIRRDRSGNINRTERTNTVNATSNLYLTGNLLIENGVLNAPPMIYIEGDWTNLAGSDAFNEGVGEVIFTGSRNSNCYEGYFNTLTVDKSLLYYLIIPAGTTECNTYKFNNGELHVSGGTFTAYDLYHQVMKGHFNVSSGIVNLHQATTDYLDLWGSITMSGGEMNLSGGDGIIYWPSGQGSASIEMSDGTIELFNSILSINSTGVFSLTENITGGYIRTGGSFYCDHSDFTPTGGTIYLHSTNDANLLVSAGSAHHIVIDKIPRGNEVTTTQISSRRIPRQLTSSQDLSRAFNVVLLDNLTCSGNLVILNGTLKLNGHETNVGQNILVHDKILMNSYIDLLVSGGSIIWFDGSVAQLSNGEIQCYGNWLVNEGATVQLPLSVVTVMRGYYGGIIGIGSSSAQFGQLAISVDGQDGLYVYSFDSTEPLKVIGDLNIFPGNQLRLDGEILRVEGNINIGNGAKLDVQNNTLEIGNNMNLNVNPGGTLQLTGTVDQNALITHTDGYYNLNVYLSGTISAESTIFEYMNTDGVNVMDGALVDLDHSFHNCTFRNGIEGGTLLNINNNQNIEIDNAIFPSNTWDSSSNVSKDLDQGLITFQNASGAYSGESFENDPHNRIEWIALGFVDLEIIDIDWSISNPYVGDTIILSATVANNGTMDIPNPVWLDLYFNLIDAPNPNMVGDLFVQVTSVPPGSPIVVPFEFEYYIAENWNSWFQIDTDEEVDESDELNNIYGPFEITWLPLPAIDDLAVQYSSNLNAIQLQWSYPLSVDNFNIYKNEDPYFTPDPGNLIDRPISTLTSYNELIDGPRFFYRVTAERFSTRIRENLPARRSRIR